jgi:hypothetical protein
LKKATPQRLNLEPGFFHLPVKLPNISKYFVGLRRDEI